MIEFTKKYKAFTMQEMMVVLVIAALVVSISIVVLNLVQKELWIANKNYQKQTEIRLLEKTLLNDLNSLEMLYHSATGELIGFSELSRVDYKFKPDFILRNKDTFFVKTDKIQFFLDAEKVHSGTVDAVDMQIGRRNLFLYKQKAAAFYMRQLWDLN